MKILVTGGLGFVGFNIIKKLNQKGLDKIIIVENLKNSLSLDIKLKRLKQIKFVDLLDKSDIKNWQEFIKEKKIECIFHKGACTDTTEKNFKYLFENNYEYTKSIINAAVKENIKLIYASSASIYGNKFRSVKEEDLADPLNYYSYSKFLVDNYLLNNFDISKIKIVGLRYFNVYGPHEENKNHMSSVVFKFYNQLKREGKLYLFEGSENFKRDFIYVDDVVEINLFFMENNYSGIYNCGTGVSESFLKVAQIVIEKMRFGSIEFIPFPEELKNKYQKFTQSNIEKLKRMISINFTPLQEGISKYLEYLKDKEESE